MLRTRLPPFAFPRPPLRLRDDGFRVRGAAPTRLESFSDAVFAFSVTLLVVSLEVPRTFAALQAMLAGFVGFAFAFAMIMLLWRTHAAFFRRFGLDDTVTVWLNGVLLFLVLFYVYPLKFVFTFISALFMGPEVLGGVAPLRSEAEAVAMMTLYGVGFVAVFGVFALMYAHAYRLREALALNAEERIRTRGEVASLLLSAGVGVLSVAAANSGADEGPFFGGITYFLIGPVLGANGALVGRRVRRLRAEEARREKTRQPQETAPQAR